MQSSVVFVLKNIYNQASGLPLHTQRYYLSYCTINHISNHLCFSPIHSKSACKIYLFCKRKKKVKEKNPSLSVAERINSKSDHLAILELSIYSYHLNVKGTIIYKHTQNTLLETVTFLIYKKFLISYNNV